MELAKETEDLIQYSLKLVRKDPPHNLEPSIRLAIYKSFGSSRLLKDTHPATLQEGVKELANLSFADYVLSWLSIITAQHVLPIWEEAIPDRYRPKSVIELALEVLAGRADFKSASDKVNGKIWNQFGNLIEQKESSYRVKCVYGASVEAALIVLGSKPFEYIEITQKTVDNDIPLGDGDVVSSAVIAYAGEFNQRDFNIMKRLEFWEWWLTEAIPQAWELAGQSSS